MPITDSPRQVGALPTREIRDLEATYAEDTAQRIATQNTALKRQIQELSQENRSLQEKLRAARDNSRFADRRVAQLEAELATRQ